jgi:hypothetical protein
MKLKSAKSLPGSIRAQMGHYSKLPVLFYLKIFYLSDFDDLPLAAELFPR